MTFRWSWLPLVLAAILSLFFGACALEPVYDTVLAAQAPPGAVSGRYLAVTTAWNDGRRDVSFTILDDAEDLQVMPLDDVALSRKMVTVDGLLPGETGYSLVEWTVALHPRTREPLVPRNRRMKQDGRVRWVRWSHQDHRDSPVSAVPLSAQSAPFPRRPLFYRISGVGDIMPGRGFGTALQGIGGSETVLGDVAPLLEAPDLLIGNLETAVTDHGAATPKSFNFKVPLETLEAVTALGFDYFHLANNHGWDYGEKGFLDTLEALDRVNVGYSGAGVDLEAARSVWEAPLPDGTMLRILSLGAYSTEGNGFDGRTAAAAGIEKPGVLWDSPENEDFIRRALGDGRVFSIVTVHGGREWQDSAGEEVQERYRRYVDWGADLVLAHHPHVLQGLENYRGAIIAYSLGNFIFPGMTGWYTGEETGILDVLLLDGRIVGVNFYPVAIDGIYLRRAEDSGIARRFWSMAAEGDAG